MDFGIVSLLGRALEIGGVRALGMVMLLVGIGAFFAFVFRELRNFLTSRRTNEERYLGQKEAREEMMTQALLQTIRETQKHQEDHSQKFMELLRVRDDRLDERHLAHIKALEAIEALCRSTNGKVTDITEKLSEALGFLRSGNGGR